jgi:hypothetical protein
LNEKPVDRRGGQTRAGRPGRVARKGGPLMITGRPRGDAKLPALRRRKDHVVLAQRMPIL